MPHSRKLRALLSSALAAVFIAGAATAQPTTATAPAAAAVAAQPLRPWEQARTDIAPDPAVRFGTLPNGMRYAIMRNTTPPGQASIRLRFDVGSMMESDQQQGLAHFLEHMAFNGSSHVPEGEMIRILERLGLSFGADTNAFTSWDQTVYQLDLPSSTAANLDTAMMVMRETASELTITQAAVERERGVVLSEERSRDTPDYRRFRAGMNLVVPGQRPAQRLPIGQVNIIAHANRDQIVDLYHRYYRPERATLVVVGDVDVEQMEARIRSRFGDWRATGPAGAEPDLGQVARRAGETRVLVEPGMPNQVQINWVTPPDLAPDSRAHRRQELIDGLAMAVLNRRLDTLSNTANAPFISASASRSAMFRAARVTTLSADTNPGHWREGMAAVEQEARRLGQYGPRQEEIDREIVELRTALQAMVSQANTRQTPAIADSIATSVAQREVITSPAQTAALVTELLQGLSLQEVTQASARLFEGSGPLVMVSSPTAIEGGEAAVQQAFNASRQTAVTAPTQLAAVTWPYQSFGASGQVVERRQVADLDTTFIRFANGVRLTVRPTTFTDNQVLVSVRFGGGMLEMPRDRTSMGWAAQAYLDGGLGRLTRRDMQQALANRMFSLGFGIDDDAFQLSGATVSNDLDAQLQLLTAYVTDPGWRPEAFQQVQSAGSTQQDQFEGSDEGVLGRDISGLLHAGDRRFAYPDRQEMARGSLADLRAQLEPALRTGPIEVIVVGDVMVDEAIRQVSATFGALPRRADPAPVSAEAARTAFPAPTAQPIVRVHNGRADQAMGMIAWPTADFFSSPQRARDLSVLSSVIRIRLMDELREREGATYSPGAFSDASQTFTNYGFVAALVEMPPERMDGFYAAMQRIAADLREHPISQDELDRARTPTVDTIERARHTNSYWLGVLAGGQSDPRRLEAVRTVLDGYRHVTPADVQRAAQTYLRDDRAWRWVVRPQATAVAAASAASPAAAAGH